MRFISNGDYIFPFDVHFYWLKQVYIWSYQTGSANPDGIIRMPGRLLDVAVFALFGNLAVSVFYLLSSFIIVFLSFFYYSKLFLKITDIRLSSIAALFFTINPIFLGNISKTGLILAAAMLPMCLVAIQKAFEKKQLRYFLLWVVFLNISLIHPFTFTVNLVVSGGYLFYLSYRDRSFMVQNLPKLLLLGIVALLLNAYFILPLASIGTVSKDVLSSNVTSTPTDYASLIDVANTGDILTGLSLSKQVFKDYEFYNNSYQLLYFAGIFSFYVILFGIYVRVEKKLSKSDRKYFAWSLAAFLVLLLLAAVNFLFVKDIITLIIGLPGGWIFRSPLKWQLYMPFTVATMLALVLTYVSQKSHRILLYTALAISFLLMNGFISVEIYHKLLTPRKITYFSALQQTNLAQKNLLQINDDRCFSFAADNSRVMTELNQLLTSKNVQVKRISLSDADSVNLSSYDYILGCQNTISTTLDGYDYTLKNNFAGDAFQLYMNKNPKPYIYANQKVIALNNPQQVGNKNQIVTKTLQSDFDFIDTFSRPAVATIGLQDAYENVKFGDIRGSSITARLSSPAQSGKQSLYVKNSANLYFKLLDHQLLVAAQPQKGYQLLAPNKEDNILNIPHEDGLNISYNDPKYDYKNIFPNASLEQGAWQKQVGDCYAYGDGGSISMSTNKADKTNGAQSLQLTSQNHLACTGPATIAVQSGQNYLFSFDYKSVQGRSAAYYISFDDSASTSYFKRFDDTKGNWTTFTKGITAPPGARNLQILVYAYPDSSGIDSGIARYDNFQLAAIPNIQNNFYLVSNSKPPLQPPQKVSFRTINPTKNIIRIQGARTAFYLETKESYSPQWSLGLSPRAAKSWWPLGSRVSVPPQDHVKINNFTNGWLVDPAKLCQSSCTQNSDGSYDLTLTMEFAPQRWFYAGAVISALTFMATIGYFIYDGTHTPAVKDYVLRRGRW